MDWSDLWLYRKKIKRGRDGAYSCRLKRPGQPKANRIVAVLYPSGNAMSEWLYSLRPFKGTPADRTYWSVGCLYFRIPTMTNGLVIYYQ